MLGCDAYIIIPQVYYNTLQFCVTIDPQSALSVLLLVAYFNMWPVKHFCWHSSRSFPTPMWTALRVVWGSWCHLLRMRIANLFSVLVTQLSMKKATHCNVTCPSILLWVHSSLLQVFKNLSLSRTSSVNVTSPCVSRTAGRCYGNRWGGCHGNRDGMLVEEGGRVQSRVTRQRK